LGNQLATYTNLEKWPLKCCFQGDHSPGKPGKVREFQSGQGKVRENGKSQGKVRGSEIRCIF